MKTTASSVGRHPISRCLCRVWVIAVLIVLWAFQALAQSPAEPSPPAKVFGDPHVWHWAPNRTYHVDNYRLILHFDEAAREVFGDETVTLQPFHAHFRRFYLDSSGLKIDSVVLERAAGPITLDYVLQEARLGIVLDREYDAGKPLSIRIHYHGVPAAGLYFINPSSAYPHRPREIWSQGEPELNHHWFPCWDYPNDMATSEIIVTVPKDQMVVSNGKLLSVSHSGGQSTYDWREEVPHSSYLTSIAVGPWRKVSDRYRETPVDYYVPRYVDEATARRSFRLTPDMIAFFSRMTGVEYPYEQYAQTTVHSYFFGGMENVSATTLTERTLHDDRADQDYPSTALVSHELGQEWLGDFVQAGDWADIWLNEGFATYLSALYTQHRESTDAYRYEIYQDQIAAQKEEKEQYVRPIVSRHYSDPFDMFDATTHEKGAAVLDMLRYVIDGSQAVSRAASQDEPFFRAIHAYLVANRTQTVETHDLIRALRDATGQELGWFFREWVFLAGHPDYTVHANYDSARKIETVTVGQAQPHGSALPVFEMPIELAFYGPNGEQKKVQIRDNLPFQQFEIPVEFQPKWVDFDPDDFIDKSLHFDQPTPALVAEAESDTSMMSRLWATQQLGAKFQPNGSEAAEALVHVLENDTFYGVRVAAAESLGAIGGNNAKAALLLGLQQADSRVRAAVVRALGHWSKETAVYDTLLHVLHRDSSYAVEAAAAQVIGGSGVSTAFNELQVELSAHPEVHVVLATLDALAATKQGGALEILLAESQPGATEQIRAHALSLLTGFGAAAKQTHEKQLTGVARAALHDDFLPVQLAGEELVGTFDLLEFEKDIAEAQNAPLAMQRDVARKVLNRLHHR